MSDAPIAGFGDVDRQTDPSSFVQYLDTVTGAATIQAYKRRSIELLRLAPGQRVLDVGCGAGDDSRAIAGIVGDRGLVVGIDFAETMVAEARRRSQGAPGRYEFVRSDVRRLEMPDGRFDAARADRVLQHLADPERALTEMSRVVRSGGWLVVSEPDWETLVVDAPNRAVVRAVLNAHRDTLANPWMGRRLNRLFQQAGLHDIAVEIITPQVTDLALARQALYLDAGVEAAVGAATISRAEADAFVAHLEAAATERSFFAAMSVFIAVGRRA